MQTRIDIENGAVALITLVAIAQKTAIIRHNCTSQVKAKEMAKRVFMRQLAIICSLIVYLLVIALILAALLTEFWVQTQSLKRNNVVSEQSYVHSGLFSGVRQLDWGLGPRKQYFTG